MSEAQAKRESVDGQSHHHRVCVVGAGPCGLTAVRNLEKSGIDDLVCHEGYDAIGGLWAYSEDAQRPSVYDSAHIISSRRLSDFRDFPMPDDYPDFPSHRQILAYLRAYAERYDLQRQIRLNSNVESAERRPEGGWRLTIRDTKGSHEETADHLIVASGHHRIPFMPKLEGTFDRLQIHSAEYRTSSGFEGKRVLVVGAGNSACDIAAALSRISGHVSLSLRTPQYIVPKTVFGRPIDIQYRKLTRLPRFLRHRILGLGLRALVGPYERYSLPQPDAEVLSVHPTLNTDILEQLTHGRVTIRGAMQSASGSSVRFADGDTGEFDAIIWSTGYQTSFPFLTDERFDWSKNIRIPLYMKMMPPDMDDIFFVGLIQPLGCIWSLADYQSEIIAHAINGRWQRPADMAYRIAREHALDAKRFQSSTRHAVEVDFHDYRRLMETQLKLAAA